MNKIKFLFLLSGIFFASSSSFAKGKQMMMALNAANGACYELDSSWTPQWANITGYWPLNGTVGTITAGTSIPATIGTSGTIGGGSASYVATKLNQGLNVNWSSSNTAANIGDGSQYDYGTNSFSVAYWVKFPTGTTNPQWGLGKGNGYASGGTAGTGGGWGVNSYSTATTFAPSVLFSDGSSYNSVSFCTVARGVWVHLAFTLDRTAGKATTYVNGAQCNQGTVSIGSMTYPSSTVGAYYPLSIGRGATTWFSGTIDEVAIWNVVLVRTDIKNIYDQQSCGVN